MSTSPNTKPLKNPSDAPNDRDDVLIHMNELKSEKSTTSSINNASSLPANETIMEAKIDSPLLVTAKSIADISRASANNSSHRPDTEHVNKEQQLRDVDLVKYAGDGTLNGDARANDDDANVNEGDPEFEPVDHDYGQLGHFRTISPFEHQHGDDVEITSSSPSPPNINIYQQKKTIAQGMMDLALISANANQFRYVIQSSGQHPYYLPSLVMIGLSLFLQVVVGIGLIWNSQYNVHHTDQMCKANRANNLTVVAIFLVTILNVFISSFGVVESSSSSDFATTAVAAAVGS